MYAQNISDIVILSNICAYIVQTITKGGKCSLPLYLKYNMKKHFPWMIYLFSWGWQLLAQTHLGVLETCD